MYSPAEENYLKALLLLSEETGETGVNELSKRLAIKMPTVNSMIKRLAEKKLVHYESYQPLQLTAKGKIEAALILRKHRLTEMYLVEKMGFGWEEVHEIAEQVEHIQSPRFFEKMDEILNHPTIDPHGSPIPDTEGKISWTRYEKLSDCSNGAVVTFVAVTNSVADFLLYLNDKDLKLGTKLTIKAIESYDKSMIVSYIGHPSETLSSIVCEKMLVSGS
ncbi:MAG: metal-dependent transcriptional regulator [Chitinophagaceae bacterium]